MTFTIDNENTITALTGANLAVTGSDPTFSSQKELEALAAGWPISRLVETWNGFAGVPPLGDLRPVKKFENKTKATRRIWEAVQKLAGAQVDTAHSDSPVEPAPAAEAAPAAKPAKGKGKAKAPAAKPAKATKAAPKAKGEKVTAKDTVIAMMKRKGGATLDEIMNATGWQAHTTRGFVSILGSKHGIAIVSTRRESDKARVYEIK